MPNKKITKWEPEDFELEMTTHWSFPNVVIGLLTMQNGAAIGRHIFQEILSCVILTREI